MARKRNIPKHTFSLFTGECVDNITSRKVIENRLEGIISKIRKIMQYQK